MDMGKMEDWLNSIPSHLTRKNYRLGVKKFEEYLKGPIEGLMGKDDTEIGHEIEKFNIWLKEKGLGDKGYSQNSARSLTNGALQYFHYFGKNPKISKGKRIFQMQMAVDEHKLTIGEVQEMAKVSDLREQVILEVFLLGLRISDAALLEWKQFQNDDFKLITKKEGVPAHIFISEEFRGLLTKYLPLLDQKNKYLLQSANEHLSVKHLDYLIHSLTKRAGLNANIHWHLGRKLFFTTGLELGIPNPNLKRMLGKANPQADETYYQNLDLKPNADQLHKVLKLFPITNGNGKVSHLEEIVMALEKENATLKERIEFLQSKLSKLTVDVEDLTKLVNDFIAIKPAKEKVKFT